MAAIEVSALSDRLGDDELEELQAALQTAGVAELPKVDDESPHTIAEGIDEDLVSELFNRLEAMEAAAEIYLPVDLEVRIELGDLRVASSQSLLDVLEEIKDELNLNDDEDEEDPEPEEPEGFLGYDMSAGHLRSLWKILHTGATDSIARNLPLHVRI